jgi:hypothetical protein
MTGIPDHLHRELDALGVRVPDRYTPPKRTIRYTYPWWKRGEECPH